VAFFFVRSSAPHQNFGGLTQSETSSSGRDAFGFLSRDPPPPGPCDRPRKATGARMHCACRTATNV